MVVLWLLLSEKVHFSQESSSVFIFSSWRKAHLHLRCEAFPLWSPHGGPALVC